MILNVDAIQENRHMASKADRLISALMKGDATIKELTNRTGISDTQVREHLYGLVDAGRVGVNGGDGNRHNPKIYTIKDNHDSRINHEPRETRLSSLESRLERIEQELGIPNE